MFTYLFKIFSSSRRGLIYIFNILSDLVLWWQRFMNNQRLNLTGLYTIRNQFGFAENWFWCQYVFFVPLCLRGKTNSRPNGRL